MMILLQQVTEGQWIYKVNAGMEDLEVGAKMKRRTTVRESRADIRRVISQASRLPVLPLQVPAAISGFRNRVLRFQY